VLRREGRAQSFGWGGKNFFEEHKNTVIFLMKTVKKYANYTQKTDIF